MPGANHVDNLNAALSASDIAIRSDIWRKMSTSQILDATSGVPTIDVSGILQQYIYDNRGGRVVIPPGRWLAAGLMLDGTEYDGTEIVWQGELLLSQRPTAYINNFGGAWCGIVLRGCSDVHLVFRGHGNRLAQPDEQHCHLLVIAGVKNLHAPVVRTREMRGDGIYIGQYSLTTESAQSENLVFGNVSCINSSDDGRNGCSIIAVDGCVIDKFVSKKVGGYVQETWQPGGLDIEPNYGFQICRNIHVGYANVESAGIQVFGCFGKDQGGTPENWNVIDLSVGTLYAKQTNTTATAGFAAAQFTRVNGLKIGKAFVECDMTSDASAILIDYAKNVDADVTVTESPRGAQYGVQGWVRYSDIHTRVKRYSKYYAIHVVGAADCRFSGFVYGSQSYGLGGVTLQKGGRPITQTNVHYSISVPHDGRVKNGYSNVAGDLMEFTNCTISNCDLGGYPALEGFGAYSGMTGITIGSNVLV